MKRVFFLLTAALFVTNSFAQIDSTALNNVFGKKGNVTGNIYEVRVGGFTVAPVLH
jgi:hypothetical protein